MANPTFSPVVKLLSTTTTAPWLNGVDGILTSPLSSADGHDHDTGRSHPYHSYGFTNPDPGIVDSSFVEDFLLRVKQWNFDLSASGGTLPPITVDFGSPFYPTPINFTWVTGGDETFDGITIVGSRTAYDGAYHLLPCLSPYAPGATDMDFVLTATSHFSMGGLTNDVTASCRVEILFSQVIYVNGLSWYPYTVFIGATPDGADDDGFTYGAGYNSVFVSQPNQIFPAGPPLTATFTTKHPAFGSPDNVITSFEGYLFSWSSAIGNPSYAQPIFSLSSLDIPIIPDPSGDPYFTFPDPISGALQRSATTGQVLFSGLVPTTMP